MLCMPIESLGSVIPGHDSASGIRLDPRRASGPRWLIRTSRARVAHATAWGAGRPRRPLLILLSSRLRRRHPRTSAHRSNAPRVGDTAAVASLAPRRRAQTYGARTSASNNDEQRSVSGFPGRRRLRWRVTQGLLPPPCAQRRAGATAAHSSSESRRGGGARSLRKWTTQSGIVTPRPRYAAWPRCDAR